jgi:hypothetical protein
MDKRIVLIGAGSAQFGLGTLSEIFYTPELAAPRWCCTTSTPPR